MRARFLFGFLCLAILGAIVASAQPPPGPPPGYGPGQGPGPGSGPGPGGRATFYTEPNYRGDQLVVEADTAIENLEFVRDNRNRSFNGRFRSVRLEGPIRVVLYQRSRFAGASTWITRSTPDLGAFSLGLNSRDTWDKSIVSIQVDPLPPGGDYVVWERRDADRVVRAVYHDILSRDPDREGLRFYTGRLMDGGWSEDQLRDQLRRSDEFKNRDLTAIVRRAYKEALGRDADPSGIATYQKKLSRGETEAELIAELANSQEGRDYHIGQVITKAYRDVLHRDPDPAGMENYRRMVRDKAYDENRIRDSLRNSDEYRQLQQKHR